MNYGNKYWDVCDMVFKYNWMHCDAKTLRRLMKKHLNYHDAGPESVGIIRDFKFFTLKLDRDPIRNFNQISFGLNNR